LVPTRYLSLALGGALVVFAVYHWLLVNSLNSELRSMDAQLAQQAEQMGALEGKNAALTKAADEFKSRLDNQAAAMRLMEVTKHEAEERLRNAAATPARQCATGRPLIQVIGGASDPKCIALKRQLDRYLAQRQAQRAPLPATVR
jgi:DNA mismatch repair ATPase MutL